MAGGSRIKQIVDNPEWQKLRVSFLGTWSKKAPENVRKLRDYLGPNPDEDQLIRVYNYVTGTGFRSKTISHPEIDVLREEVKTKLEQLRQLNREREFNS